MKAIDRQILNFDQAVKWLDSAVNAGQDFSVACARYAKRAGVPYNELRDAWAAVYTG